MTVLTIDRGKYPDGCLATPQSGGSLAASTTYHYRVAVVTDEGETCACASFSGATTDVNKKLALSWNKVAGAKASGGYRIYRNTSDAWGSGSLFLLAVSTNSYTDDGSVSPGAGLPVTFTSDRVTALPENIPSLTAQVNIPGKEGGDLQYLGSPPHQLRIEGMLRGASAKTDLDKLVDFRTGGIPLYITISAYSQTWIQAYYLIAGLQWFLEPGIINDADAIVLRFFMDLLKV